MKNNITRLLNSAFFFYLFHLALSTGALTATGTQSPIPDTIWNAMVGKSWHANLNCPSGNCRCPKRQDLTYLKIPYKDISGKEQIGEMITSKRSGEEILRVFSKLFDADFRIFRMDLVHKYNGNDNASMFANNTSAFNCRLTSSGSRLSDHSSGEAIDVNPLQNPYVRNDVVLPRAGFAFRKPSVHKRDSWRLKLILKELGSSYIGKPERAGIVVDDDVVVRAFDAIGWKWGGRWPGPAKDYQHFSKSGN